MTMLFQTVSEAIKDTLATAAAGRYNVVGYQKQTQSADVINALKMVQVFYGGGDFPKDGGSVNGPVSHNMDFGIGLTIAVSSKADKTVLDDPGSTPAQISAALALAQESSYLADLEMDDFFNIIFQILMDARNQDFSPSNAALKYQVSNRWIRRIQKDSPQEQGQYLTLTGSMVLTLSGKEEIVGETLTTGLEGVDTVITQDGDPNANTEINVITTP